MKKIFLIGGGEITKKETTLIDKKIISEGGGKKSNILFFPTAANDSQEYIDSFYKYYSSLGCKNITVAKITSESITDIRKKINSANILYFGGGDTSLLIALFQQKKLILDLKRRIKDDIVIAGISAGAIAMGKTALLSELNKTLHFGLGFGLLTKIICVPHYKEKYKNQFIQIKSLFPKNKILLIPDKMAVYIEGEKHIKIRG